MSQTGWKC